MNSKWKVVGLSAAAALLAARPALAETRDDVSKLEAEVKQLRAEVDALRAKPAEAKPATLEVQPAKVELQATKVETKVEEVAERLDVVEIKQKDAVVAGDIPGSFRVPGTELSLHLYGFVELNYVHDFKGDNSDIDYSTFAPYLPLRGSAEAARTNRDYLTGRTSRIGLDAAQPTRFGILGAKVEGDFNNEPRLGNTAVFDTTNNKAILTQQATSSYGFRIRHAYGQYAGFLAGQTWSTFMDVDNAPETVDYNGPIGGTFIRQPLIRYTYATPSWGGFTAAFENSDSYVLDASGNVITTGISTMPDVVARWDKAFDWGAVSVRGVTHQIRIKNDGQPAASTRGYGGATTVLVKTREGADFLSIGLTGGDGIGRYLNYVEGTLYDAATNKLLTERAAGLIVGYQFKPSDLVRFNACYGTTRNWNNDFTSFAASNGLDAGRFGINRWVRQAHFGAIVTPIKSFDLGFEGIWGDRETLSGQTGDMLRFNFSAKYYIN